MGWVRVMPACNKISPCGHGPRWRWSLHCHTIECTGDDGNKRDVVIAFLGQGHRAMAEACFTAVSSRQWTPSPGPPRLAGDASVVGSYRGGADPNPVPDGRLAVDGITMLFLLRFTQLPLNTYIMLYVSSLEATNKVIRPCFETVRNIANYSPFRV